jgi:aromatic acid exporter family member 1
MKIPVFRQRRAAQISAAARAVAQRTPVTLTVARQRAQPTAVTIVRLTSTAILAYLLALVLTSTPRPVLAPLTALLVVQVSLYQTVRSAITKVASVVSGVLLAIGLSTWVGFTWWSLGITIAIALVIGYALRLGENILEVPISAMLILSVGTQAAATSRVIETFVGTGAGLAAGLVLSAPRVQPAEEAIKDLCAKMADLLGRIASGLTDGSVPDSAGEWLRQTRLLGNEIRRVDDALRQAEESIRLNPRSMRQPFAALGLREGLETLEHETTAIRGLARSLADISRLADDDNPLSDPDVRRILSEVLWELAAAVRTYGSLATEHDPARHQVLESELERHLAAAQKQQDRLSERLGTDPAARPVGWPLRGELISHLDRLRTELRTGKPGRKTTRRRIRSWRRPAQAGQQQPRSPARARRRR